MALKGALLWLCSLAVLSSAAKDETSPQNCNSGVLEHLSAQLKVAVECGESLLSAWSTEQTAALIVSMRNLTESLHKHQLNECKGAEPKRCPEPQVPDNGGLACVTVANKRYCKPLCNHGYDFSFLRLSRLYEECSEQTGYKWLTQFVGGNRLAVCDEARGGRSGAQTAYFPADQDCLTTKSNSTLQSNIIAVLSSELKTKGIQGEPESACLVCG